MIDKRILCEHFNRDFFRRIKQIKQNEMVEVFYAEYLENLFDSIGLIYKRNKTKYPDYEFSDGAQMEVKSTKSGSRFKCNDTIPHPNVWYLIFITSKDKTILCKGDDLITDEERTKLRKLKEELKKSRLTGFVATYPRINISITIPNNLIDD